MLPVLEQLGLLPILVERGLARKDVERRMFVGGTRRVTLPSGNELGALISQPGLLSLLLGGVRCHRGERRPEIEAAQAIQLRAYGMVKKPLLVEHIMFTMLGAVMRFKKFAPPASVTVEPRHVVRATA